MCADRRIARVVVDVPSKETDRPFDYVVPESLLADTEIGSRVKVPFGPRTVMGYVVDLATSPSASLTRLKAIIDVLDVTPPLTPELVRLAFWLSEVCLCRKITALHAMVPAVLKGRYHRTLRVHPHAPPATALPDAERVLIERIEEKREVPLSQVLAWPGVNRTIIRRLIREKRLLLVEHVGDRATLRTVTWVKPALSPDELSRCLADIPARAVRQRAVMEHFIHHPEEISLPDLLSQAGATRSVVGKLVEKGWLTWEEREVYRDPYGEHAFERKPPLPLTDQQQQALDTILSALNSKKARTILLHGVTGSGKTEVYLQAIDATIRQGKQAIVLVPEISLTPQMVKRFKERFGSEVAVLHSGLSDGERYDEWRKIRSGEVRVAIGARSAIFAPFEQLGLIIIDEEHESSYKQEEQPKYHARDVALWRAREHGAAVVLGSATPAVESYFLARTGVYEWVTLPQRVNNRPFPTVDVVDMREELRQGNRSLFSRKLRTSLTQCVERGEQAVLLLNRRGYSTFVLCRDCGEAMMCPHCDISLTYHQTNRTLRCHYCGYATQVPSTCPACSGTHIRYFGTGTQRVEEELARLFPGIRVIRMDVDTTSRKGAHERLLKAFGSGQADVLLGTQMIAKGLDFPRVTLVGVIAADTSLYLPDFRAAERTFQLLMQVSGRAGRHQLPGRVVIQTYNPEHYSVDLAARYQTESFYRQECRLRKQHRYPPFCGLFTLLLTHPDRAALMRAAHQAAIRLQQDRLPGVEVLGPVPAPIPRLKDRYRMQVMVKYNVEMDSANSLLHRLRELEDILDDPRLKWSVDRDGRID
ncbi:primosomal protein N' [Polycladomyces sp. WAk]|uniref:Replication restart protein PriA n=1 Tax=Polycladomyces zharkentensis TaxID=2807616 RepID=A0ABS2WFJ7_9BACL|nr:primosomal protein N' [Polycladomyces sp. WAk]MBN2908306.1 primosomal protein N' [Polycladomyces sp. WAk]